jgi:NifU-like protein involved in Fe-S cluster formation
MLSTIAADHVHNRRNQGPLASFTHYGMCGEKGEGPHVEIWLFIENGVIRQAAYGTHGCPSSVAAASMLCQLATGREVRKMIEFTDKELIVILGGLPEGKEEFATMAIAAYRSATEAGL